MLNRSAMTTSAMFHRAVMLSPLQSGQRCRMPGLADLIGMDVLQATRSDAKPTWGRAKLSAHGSPSGAGNSSLPRISAAGNFSFVCAGFEVELKQFTGQSIQKVAGHLSSEGSVF
jgi:hypothetical protein